MILPSNRDKTGDERDVYVIFMKFNVLTVIPKDTYIKLIKYMR